jgi:pimeloyl-ACP methyl ester carboxylesterase
MLEKIMEAWVGRDDLRRRQAGSVRGWTLGVGLLVSILTLAACDAPTQASDPRAASAPAQSPARAAPAKDGFADVDGGRIHYQVYGDLASGKTPLLVLHGSIMSAEQMRPMIEPFTASRPVIAIDQRGHGRTGDLPGPITYEMLADDAAGVLQALNVPTADVLGYSMGGTAAFFMAIRHPDRVGKQIIVSGTARRGGWYPEVQASFAKWTPEMFAGSPLEAEYKRLSPTPEAFPTLIEELSDMDTANYDRSDEAIRSIDDKTMIIVGDADGMQLAYAVELFKLRGGVDVKEAMQGFLSEVPRARLAVLPGTSHTGMMVEAKLLAQLAIPFLDDAKPEMPPGFLKSTNGDEASKGEGVD